MLAAGFVIPRIGQVVLLLVRIHKDRAPRAGYFPVERLPQVSLDATLSILKLVAFALWGIPVQGLLLDRAIVQVLADLLLHGCVLLEQALMVGQGSDDPGFEVDGFVHCPCSCSSLITSR
ncbi:hypothetical protein D3C75_795490 [compost metagenome]